MVSTSFSFEAIANLHEGFAITFSASAVVCSPQIFLNMIKQCGELDPLFKPWLHIGLVTDKGPLAPPHNLQSAFVNIE